MSKKQERRRQAQREQRRELLRRRAHERASGRFPDSYPDEETEIEMEDLVGDEVVEYVVTREPFEAGAEPPEFARQKDEPHRLVSDDPTAAIPRLESLLQRYSGLPVLYNRLSFACCRALFGLPGSSARTGP